MRKINEDAIKDLETEVWYLSHIFHNCTFGKNCYTKSSVSVDRQVKIQNKKSLYEILNLEEDVICQIDRTAYRLASKEKLEEIF